MVYDSARGKVILFGGASGGWVNDTWSYDPVANAWTDLVPPNPPPARGVCGLVQISTQQMFLFGGTNSGTNFSDQWLLNLPGGSASSLSLTSPNGGESWGAGTSQPITWTSSNLTGNLAITLSRDGGATYTETIAASVLVSAGSFNWTVSGPASSTCRVKLASLSNPSVFDASDGNFTISSNPAGVTVWPGDADNSGAVNGLDFTKIFLYWGKSGQGRTNPSNQWRAESCPNINPPWNPTETLYADCNGDGTVNGLDFTVVFLNWSKTHTLAQGGNWNPSDLQLPVLPGTSIGLKLAKEQNQDAGLVTYALRVSPLEDLNSVYAVLRFDPKGLALDSSFGQGGILPCGFFSAAQVMAKSEPGSIELAADLPGIGASGGRELLLFRFRLLQPSLSKDSLSAPTLEGSPVFTFADGRQQRLESSR